MAINLTKDTFDAEIANGTVLVDFWASWCGPCRMLAPIIDQIAAEHSDVKICKVNVDEEQELAMRFRVMSIPTVILFKNGKQADISVGLVPKASLEAMLMA